MLDYHLCYDISTTISFYYRNGADINVILLTSRNLHGNKGPSSNVRPLILKSCVAVCTNVSIHE